MRKLLLLLACIINVHLLYAQNYIFFQHNMAVEVFGLDGAHPEYGKVEYNEILARFRAAGFIVISDVRPKDADAMEYARKTQRQIDSLISNGVKPSHITVVGTSKGAYIAQKVSTIMKNKQLNFVFIGICSEAGNEPDIDFYGNVLSIFEKSDNIGHSCEQKRLKAGKNVVHYKEIELNTGRKHGFLYKALPEWMEPSIKWANQNYK